MLQLMDLARENAALKSELLRSGEEMEALQWFPCRPPRQAKGEHDGENHSGSSRRERPLHRGRSRWRTLAGRDEAPEGGRRGVHPVEAAALAVPEAQQLMLAAFYTPAGAR